MERESEQDYDFADRDATIFDEAEVRFDTDLNTTSTTPPENSTMPSLPEFKETTYSQAAWQDISGEDFVKAIDEAYNQTVHWVPNLFMLPSGSSGKQFIVELAKLYDAFASESSYESFAIKAAMTMPALLLQKPPHSKSKTHDHILCLNRHIALWEKNDVAELLMEGKLIQSHLRSSFGGHPHEDKDKLARTFAKLMMEGRVRSCSATTNDEYSHWCPLP